MSSPLHVVWFKRDLRIHDHPPLTEAAKRGPVLPLYVVEPDLGRQPFAWRKKWSRNWQEVKYCSDRCRVVRIAKPLKATSSKV